MSSNDVIPPSPQELIDAGLDLIAQSKLAELGGSDGFLFANDQVEFEATVRASSHKQRRLASWILFSTGAEYIVKGVCLEFGLGQMKENPQTGEPDLGTLSPYYYNKKNPPLLKQLADKIGKPDAASDLIKWCRNLANIRNREVHVFIPNVRGARNFPQLDSGLLPLLNFLLNEHNGKQGP